VEEREVRAEPEKVGEAVVDALGFTEAV